MKRGISQKNFHVPDPKRVLLERTNFCRGKLITVLLYQNRIEKDFKLAKMITTGCLFIVFYMAHETSVLIAYAKNDHNKLSCSRI